MRRVVLPSGKTIEFVYFRRVAGSAPPPPPHDLHVCPDCGSAMVYPVEWEAAGHEHWEVCLRCPKCEWSAEGESSTRRASSASTRARPRHPGHWSATSSGSIQANMEDEIERFIRALQADQIWPMDF